MKTPIICDELSKIDSQEFIIKIFTGDKNHQSSIVEINKNGLVVYFIKIKVKFEIFKDDIGISDKKVELLELRDNTGKILKPNDKETLNVEQFFQNKIICDIFYFAPAYKD